MKKPERSKSGRDDGGSETATIILCDASGDEIEALSFIGSRDQVIVPWRAVFERILVHTHCRGMALMHNHVSGIAEPSHVDRITTRQLHGALKLLGVRLIDHEIVTPTGRYSFRDAGEL